MLHQLDLGEKTGAYLAQCVIEAFSDRYSDKEYIYAVSLQAAANVHARSILNGWEQTFPKTLYSIAKKDYDLFPASLKDTVSDPHKFGIYHTWIHHKKERGMPRCGSIAVKRIEQAEGFPPLEPLYVFAFSIRSKNSPINKPEIALEHTVARIRIATAFITSGESPLPYAKVWQITRPDLQDLISTQATEELLGAFVYQKMLHTLGKNAHIDYEPSQENLKDLGRRFKSLCERKKV